jgi:PQQ-dependent catabolism-associated CXXCW motif protein
MLITRQIMATSHVVFFSLILPAGFTLSPFANADADVPQPDGYRMEYYDDAVPDALDGATRVTAIDVQELQATRSALVVDVIPDHRRPDFLPENQIWVPVPHKGIPGALWLPDVGFGALSDVTEAYLKTHLDKATDGNLDHPVVFYCRVDCWMSWNTAKRAMSYGYTDVYWFADGTDDWFFEGFDFAILKPAEDQRQANQ